MIEKVFYNIFVLGGIISICIFPILLFLSKNKYKYNIKNVYKIFLIILLLLFIPFNSLDFSKIKGKLKVQKQEVHNTQNLLDEAKLETNAIILQNNNIVIELNDKVDNTIKIENNLFYQIFYVLPYIWLGISILLLLYNLIVYLLFIYNLKLERESINLADISKEIGLKRKVICESSQNISTPITIGIFNRRIVFPKEIVIDEKYEHILRHELFHIKNRDIEYKFLLLLLNCIYWFNPIIYNFTKQVNEVLELNCDENVLQGRERSYRLQYAETLLDQIEKNRNKQYSFSMNFANRKENIMSRFSNIMDNGKKKSIASVAIILSLILIIALGVILSVPNINFASIKDQEPVLTNTTNYEKVIDGTNTVNQEVILEKTNTVNYEKVIDERNTVNQDAILEKTNTTNYEVVTDTKSVENQETVLVKDNSVKEEAKLTTTVNNIDFSKGNTKILEEPVHNYEISERFGKINEGMHTGLDFKTESGTEIYACMGGEIIYSGWKGSYGNFVIIKHADNFCTFYAHCSELLVKVGDIVKTGEVIAKVGATGNTTGPQLHLEVRVDNVAKNPEDYIRFK